MRKKQFVFLLLAAGLLAAIAFITWPHPALAQCGSSASSCKNCHEVKKADPVNTTGAWHTAHAFGDFCEFCHAGNVKAKDATAAHAGLIDPLGDVKGSCQSCHPNDYMSRAQKYADALGKPLGSGGAPAAAGASAHGGQADTSSGPCGPAAPSSGQLIDLNEIYATGLAGGPTANVGNIVLLVLIGATVSLFGGLASHYEHPLERGIRAWNTLISSPALAAAVPARGPSRDLGALMPYLSSADPETLRSLAQLLSDKENGGKVLQALSRTDLQVLAELGEGDQRALSALLTLAKEMKSSR